jgi:sentrin-specific protease 7
MISVHLEGQSPDIYFDGWEMDDANIGIVLYPDYISYRDIYRTNATLSFSSSCIAIKYSTACEDQETFVFQWGTDDIVDIQSQFCPRIETAMVKMRVISKDAEHGEDAHGSSGIEEVNFSVVDPDWHTKQEEITSFNIYKPLWIVMPDSDIERNGDASIGENGASCSKRYFPVFDEAFDEVIYPKGDSDAVSISKRDVDLLQPDTFVNDTIIDFYMKYLKNKIELIERQRFHFFNSFFFRKLADLDKDPNSVFDARAAFLRVRKWTRKLNLFEKEFIFIPVNFNYHWSLLVICHPGEVATYKDEDAKNSEKVPCILHMDSIRGSHSGLKSLLQSYLWEEWKERHKEASEDVSSRFLNMRFVSLELPQQQNSFDCGLFLLHYAELFLEKSPLNFNFNPFKITKFSKFLTTDWFQPSEASLKRALIQRLIYNLLDDSSPEKSPPRIDHRNYEQIPDIPKSNHINNDMPIELLSERCVGTKSSSDLMMRCENDDDGTELSLLPTTSSSIKNPHCDSGLASRGFFYSESSVGSLLAFNQSSAFNDLESARSPIKEEIEVDVEVEAEGGEHSHKRSRILQEPSRFPHASQDMQTDPSCWNPIDENDSISSPQPLKCGSDEDNSQADGDLTSDKHPMSEGDYDENEDSLKSRTENLSGFCIQENATPSPTNKDEETVPEEPGMCRPVKKMRVTTEVTGEDGDSRSVMKDLHL